MSERKKTIFTVARTMVVAGLLFAGTPAPFPSLSVSLEAIEHSCYDIGLVGESQACETSTMTQCVVGNPNPGDLACSEDFEDTCNAFCGFNNWIGDDCYWDYEDEPVENFYCAHGWYIRCICSAAH